MAGSISKNARRSGSHAIISRWGGEIKMHSVFENGKMHHYAECSKSKNRARKPSMLM